MKTGLQLLAMHSKVAFSKGYSDEQQSYVILQKKGFRKGPEEWSDKFGKCYVEMHSL